MAPAIGRGYFFSQQPGILQESRGVGGGAMSEPNPLTPESPEPTPLPQVSPGMALSDAAFRRDLPGLLEKKRLRGRWALYHGEECLGIARTKWALIQLCLKRGLPDDSYYVGWIMPCELLEVIENEELDYRPDAADYEYEDDPPPLLIDAPCPKSLSDGPSRNGRRSLLSVVSRWFSRRTKSSSG
jgi:hypothetical protein